MEISPTAPVFDELLLINRWAEPYWHERIELIRSGSWNINAINQGGNQSTRTWLAKFHAARAQATLERLKGKSTEHDNWVAKTYLILSPLLATTTFWAPIAGVAGGQMVDGSEEIQGYSQQQMQTDLLLLVQASLRELTLEEPLDISGRAFTFGLDLVGSKFDAPLRACEAGFGQYSEFDAATYGDLDFSGSQFTHGVSFVASTFGGDAKFTKAHFRKPAAFDGADFRGLIDFAGTEFDASAQFCGTRFRTRPGFSGAVFRGDTSFADAVFDSSADFGDVIIEKALRHPCGDYSLSRRIS